MAADGETEAEGADPSAADSRITDNSLDSDGTCRLSLFCVSNPWKITATDCSVYLINYILDCFNIWFCAMSNFLTTCNYCQSTLFALINTNRHLHIDLKLSQIWLIDPVGLPSGIGGWYYLPQSQSNSRKPRIYQRDLRCIALRYQLMRVKGWFILKPRAELPGSFLPFFLSDSP